MRVFNARAAAFGALCACVALALGVSTRAESAAAEGAYSETMFSHATEATIDVVIVPPAHGQIYNDNGVLGGDPPSELGPFNSYLKALERGIEDWRRAIDQMAPAWLSEAVTINSYVVGRDEIPAEVDSDPEVLILNEESKGNILGLATAVRPACLILNSSWFVKYFAPEDFYWVSVHELGHCLGLGHIVDDNPPDDLMSPTYKQPIGASSNRLGCISTLNIATLERSFGFLRGLSPSHEDVSVPVSEYRRMDCGTLAGPGSTAPPEPAPSTSPESSPSPSAEPDPGSSPSPDPTSSASAEPSPSPSAEATPSAQEDRARWVGVRLRRHLVVGGLIESDGDDATCTAGTPVSIQRRAGGRWRTVARAETNSEGLFRKRVSDRTGRYRVLVPEHRTSEVGCLRAVSRAATHRH